MAGYTLSIGTSGFDEIAERLKNPNTVRLVEKTMLDVATKLAEGKAKELAPTRIGTLRGSITSKIEESGRDMVGKVGSTIEYAKYQEFGTGIHAGKGYIYPKRATMLHFFTKGGDEVFAKRVAGTPPRKFIAGGLAAVQANLSKIFDIGKRKAHELYGL